MHGGFTTLSIKKLRIRKGGRKRKSGRRHPSGKIDQRHPDDKKLAELQPHRRHLPADCRSSEKAGYPLGDLNLRGILSNQQHEAGQRYAAIVGRYRAVIGSPMATAKSGRGFDCAGACVVTEACECRSRKTSYDRVYEALRASGQRALVAVNNIAVHQNELDLSDWARVMWTVVGLDALVTYFGLTNGRKSPLP